MLSLMVAFFLSIANMQFLVESDVMHRAKTNALMYSLSWGQLQHRSRNLLPSPTKKEIILEQGFLRESNGKPYGNVTAIVSLGSDNTTINAKIEIE
jgi:hypothetical protein